MISLVTPITSSCQNRDPPSRRSARPRAPLIIAFVVVACVLGTYWLYVRGRNEYFVSRNLRILSSFSGQLDRALTSAAGFVGNYAAASDWPLSDREKLLPQFSRTDCTEEAFPGLTDAQITSQARQTPGEMTAALRLQDRQGIQWLQVALSGLVPLGAFDTVFLANAKGDVPYSVAPPHAPSTLLWSQSRLHTRIDRLPRTRASAKRLSAITMVTSALTK